MHIKILDKTINKLVFSGAEEALGFFQKLCGLMFKKPIASEEALIFYHTSSIHTFFMRFPIDVIFLDKNKKVIKIYNNLGPDRIIYCRNSYCTIECLGTEAASKNIEVGHYFEFIKITARN